MKKQDVRHGQAVVVKHEGYGTVVTLGGSGCQVKMLGGDIVSALFRELTLVAQPEWQCPTCESARTRLVRDMEGDAAMECVNCGLLVKADLLAVANEPTKSVRISAAALELGNLVTLWHELRSEEGLADVAHGMAHIQSESLPTKQERAEAHACDRYFDGSGYGFMKSRQYVEGLMEVLGLTDTWQLRCRDLNVHNANARS